jgi:hypothetical protein
MVGAATTYIIILLQVKWLLEISNNSCKLIFFSGYEILPHRLNRSGGEGTVQKKDPY